MSLLRTCTIFVMFLLIFCSGSIGGFEAQQMAEKGTQSIYETLAFSHLNSTWRNFSVSSPEFRKIATETYAKVLPCITRTWMMANSTVNFSFPEDAEQHYWEIFSATAPFRKQRPHSHSGYKGPWIENRFISHFSKNPLSYFGGLIPVYVQWVDNQVQHNKTYLSIRNVLNKVLRPDVLYFTVSQCATGLAEMSIEHPNLLVFSAGGFGHVAIPLIKGEIKPFNIKVFWTDVGFYGNVEDRGNRKDMLEIFKNESEKHSLVFRLATGKKWMNDMSTTKFNLAPRGIGRTSFRFAEIIQMGRMPVFLYNDIPWIPYEGSSISIKYYGLVGRLTEDMRINTIPDLVKQMKNMTNKAYEKRIKHLREIRYLFTYQGVLHEIELFLQDPFGPRGGHLTCATFPHTTGCCG